MEKYIFRYLLVESLVKLKEEIRINGIPKEVIEAAVESNPWFTEYYINRSLDSISTWFDKDELESFLAQYPERKSSPFYIGVIAAGNIPFVGFHDVLIPILSGHKVGIKTSHRDRILMNWLINTWVNILPALAERIYLDSLPDQIDFLITTGSNNTARYIEANYGDIPKIIRRNRFSVAVLEGECSEADANLLCEDIFLYNGLGCRNVSNLLVKPNFDWKSFVKKISNYQMDRLNPLYLERVLHQKSLMRVLNRPIEVTGNILITSENSLGISSMGILRKIKVENEAKLHTILAQNKSNIQCIVGRDTAFGMTQKPVIGNFADDVDTMKLLVEL